MLLLFNSMWKYVVVVSIMIVAVIIVIITLIIIIIIIIMKLMHLKLMQSNNALRFSVVSLHVVSRLGGLHSCFMNGP